MIKIIEKEVKIKEYDVEPKVTTLYYIDKYIKDVKKIENCVFKNATPIGWGASDANEYRLEYKSNECYLPVRVDIKTGIVKEESYHFFDYEQALSIHKKLRIEYLKDRIKVLKKYQKELEELKNFEKKGGK